MGQIYQHYKNEQLYDLCLEAEHPETSQQFVVYLGLYTSEKFPNNRWARPISMFFENVTHEGNRVPRFTKLEGIVIDTLLPDFGHIFHRGEMCPIVLNNVLHSETLEPHIVYQSGSSGKYYFEETNNFL
jgi:hypothetical protein